MIADGLTKTLPGQKFRDFIRMISLVDIQDRLQAEKRQEALKEQAADTTNTAVAAAAEAIPSADLELEWRGKSLVTMP
jgi:hypothetical protein